MWQHKEEVLFDLITRDAILVWNGQIYQLDGPFRSKADAVKAAEEFKSRWADAPAPMAA